MRYLFFNLFFLQTRTAVKLSAFSSDAGKLCRRSITDILYTFILDTYITITHSKKLH